MPRCLRPLVVLAAVAAVSAVAIVAQSAKSPSAAMADAANEFLASLSVDHRAKAAFAYDSEERTKWHFVPLQDAQKNPTRKGVRMEELTAAQKAAALKLLKAGLSATGYDQAVQIMGNEKLLAELEPNGTNVRNPEWYFVSVFGQPSSTGTWGWRIEGHHLSVNLTIERGQIVSTGPTVFATNPATVKDGAKKGLRILGETETAAQALIASLDPDQAKAARQAKQFPEIDVKTRASVGEPVGIVYAKLSDNQKAMLRKLVGVYAGRMPGETAEAELKKIADAGWDQVRFAYCIEDNKPGQPYTYRVHGPTFVVEFLNVQGDAARNPANHIHSGWRKLPADFGLSR
jgi:hypothetical protein